MSRLSVVLSVVLIAFAPFASADHEGETFTDWARVTKVTPQYERVNKPQKECSTEIIYDQPEYRGSNERSYGGAVLGGVAGGILGHQVGKGRGREAATAAGAVIGAIVGDQIGNRSPYRRAHYEEPEGREIKRCRVIDNWENQITGYQVEYDYGGHRYTRFMSEDPGRKLKVKVSVDPV